MSSGAYQDAKYLKEQIANFDQDRMNVMRCYNRAKTISVISMKEESKLVKAYYNGGCCRN